MEIVKIYATDEIALSVDDVVTETLVMINASDEIALSVADEQD
jgi:hypothetical protein